MRSAKRKKLTITVERDQAVIVHAPQKTPDDEIQRVIESKRQWILAKLRHPQKYQNRMHPPGKEVVNGESAPYLGRDYRIEIAETASGDIEFTHLFLVPPGIRPSAVKFCGIGTLRAPGKRYSAGSSNMPVLLA